MGEHVLEHDETVSARGLEALLEEAWVEARRRGRVPAGWRPFDPARAEGIALRDEERLLGYAAVRPMEGMDSLDFFYVRAGARRPGAFRALMARAVERLKERGLTKIIYAGYGWWRDGFPASFARAFGREGFGRFEGVFMIRLLDRDAGPAPLGVPAGYEVRDWRDDWYDDVCACMLASPEPKALYWDLGLCQRSIIGAASPLRPLFPDGFGQVVFHGQSVVGFALSTPSGYVNHVYTHPDHRGRGLGAAAITRLLGALARKALSRATILTHDTNPGAIQLYERLGFAVDFRYPQFFLRW